MKLLYVHINMKQLDKKRKADNLPDADDEDIDFPHEWDREEE